MASQSESQQLGRVIYRAPSIRTLNRALCLLHGLPHPILQYRQVVQGDADWEVTWNPDQGVMMVRLPSEVGWVTGIRNSAGARMVTYVKDPRTDFIQEVEVREHTEINGMSRYPSVIRIYTRRPVEVTMDVYLIKRLSRL